MAVTIVYQDVASDFRKTLFNDVGLYINTKSINRSIIGILSTRKGDAPLDPLFGCDLSDQLFENIDAGTVLIVRQSILEALRKYEPRIENIVINVQPNYDQNELIIDLSYQVIDASLTDSIKFKLFG